MTTVIFNSLIEQFPTADALYNYLRSPEGGSLMVLKEYDTQLALIHYNKLISNMSLPHVPHFRSVIWNTETNRPVCVAPPHGAKFIAAVDATLTDFVTEEFIDGIMINQFHDGTGWKLATRTQVDASGSFFGKRSFAELFNETFAAAGLTTEILTPGVSYSWVLQHPEERIVVAPAYGIATLKLVFTYSSTGLYEIPAALTSFLPARYPLTTLEDVNNFVEAEGRRRQYQFKGVVLKTADGTRYKLRSKEYEAARFLRGNQAKRSYTWLELWSSGNLPAYLRIYPEEQCDADAVIAKFKAVTQEAHDLYLKVYRKRELPLGQAPQKYRKLLWDAHKVGKGAYYPHMRAFMNEQDTARKLWLVNYEQRYGNTTNEIVQPVEEVAATNEQA